MNPQRFLIGTLLTLALLLTACGPSAGQLTSTAAAQQPTNAILTPGFTATSAPAETGEPGGTPGAPATAVTTPGTPEMTSVGPAMETPGGTQVAGVGTATAESAQEPVFMRGSDLIGLTLNDNANAKIGTVEDVLVNEEGDVQYIVFDSDMALNTGSQRVALDWSMFNIETGDEEMTFTGAKTDIEAAPVLNENLLDSTTFVVRSAQATPTTGAAVPVELANLIRVSKYSNFDPRNSADENLGEVEDLVFNLRAGILEHSIVNFGGFLGLGAKNVAVPWEGFQLSRTADNEPFFLLNVSRDKLEQAPQIESLDETLPRWPETISPSWDSDASTYWQTVGFD